MVKPELLKEIINDPKYDNLSIMVRDLEFIRGVFSLRRISEPEITEEEPDIGDLIVSMYGKKKSTTNVSYCGYPCSPCYFPEQ